MKYQIDIKRLKRGKEREFKLLFDSYAPLFKGIAFRYLNDFNLSNDIVQESFVKIYKNIKSFKEEGNFEGWMKRIVVNCCLNYIKSQKKVVFETNEVLLNKDSGMQDAISNMTFNEIIALINKLPDGYRTIFNLSVLDGYSHKEISENLNITESASRSQLTKAKSKLRNLIENAGLKEAWA
ncbi:MAG: sigma-70 family RNA polymerase sigma factor [Flavobacteriales bacterium]|nr:sigma-70 family RNA polymerase sigma factor [Flavobacteriales bacterium]